MFSYRYLALYVISLMFISAAAMFSETLGSDFDEEPSTTLKPTNGDTNFTQDKEQVGQEEKVKIQLFYESMCPYCRAFDRRDFIPTLKKLGVKYLDIHVYPYGNAETTTHDDGTVEFECQHGPRECYGNMLHACAINYLNNLTKALYYNSCMMDTSQNHSGSDDEAADKCGKQMEIDAEPIKSCAKGSKGQELLKYYGNESQKVHYSGVPTVLINGEEFEDDDFWHGVCTAFTKPPKECNVTSDSEE